MMELGEIKKREFKPGGDPGPESFCTIVDSSSLWEGIFSIYTIRRFHEQPIYVICDKIAEEHINLAGLENVHTRATIDPESNSEITDGLFNGGFQDQTGNQIRHGCHLWHPISLMYRKPEAMDFALETNTSTLFSDCDVYYTSAGDRHLGLVLIPVKFTETQIACASNGCAVIGGRLTIRVKSRTGELVPVYH